MKKRLLAGDANAYTAVALRSLFPANGVTSFTGAGIPVGSKFFRTLDSSCLINHLLLNARDLVECSRLCSNSEDRFEPSKTEAFSPWSGSMESCSDIPSIADAGARGSNI